MATPLKTLVLRFPTCQATTAGFVSKASFSTTTRPASCLARSTILRQFFSPAIAAPRTFARANSTQADVKPTGTTTEQPPVKNPNAGQNNTQPPALTWDKFFELRVKRRRLQVLFSGLGGIFGLVSGGAFLSTGAAEPIVTQIPLDPFATLGIMTIACGGMGWLAGPSVGTGIFYLFNRQFKQQMKDKEAQFFARIKKHRANPANSNANNPVPDFYGEKIQSVKGYRRWLKDQKAFNKKKNANLF